MEAIADPPGSNPHAKDAHDRRRSAINAAAENGLNRLDETGDADGQQLSNQELGWLLHSDRKAAAATVSAQSCGRG
jgi:hypothetical protein